jgi:hypothetical protein
MVGALIASAFGQDLKVWKSPDASLRSKGTELAFPHANVTEDGSEAVLVLRFAPSFSLSSKSPLRSNVIMEYRRNTGLLGYLQ